jgi:ComF family protein
MVHTGNLLAGFLGLLLPADCVVCGQPLESSNQSHICKECWESVMLLASCEYITQSTPKSILMTVTPGARESTSHSRACLPRRYVPLYSATRYEGMISLAIRFYKYGGRRGILRGFARIIDRYLDCSNLGNHQFQAVVPVPLHASRYRQRGFNQAEDLARILSHRLRVPLNNDCLVRIAATPPQTKLSSVQRRSNVRRAFAMNPSATCPPSGGTVLLVDDVCTTGSTLQAAAEPLCAHGLTVFLFALARSSKDRIHR